MSQESSILSKRYYPAHENKLVKVYVIFIKIAGGCQDIDFILRDV